MNRESRQFIHEGDFVAEVAIVEIDDGTPWSPSIGLDDMNKLDRVRMHLRHGDTAAASKDARVFKLIPVAGEPVTASAAKGALGVGFGEPVQSSYRFGES